MDTVTILTLLVSLIRLLPGAVKLLVSIGMGGMKKPGSNPAELIGELNEIVNALNKAQTDAEREQVARRIAALWANGGTN